ncbi:TPA: recombinase family protein [Yersinia enterocolitica]|nr:recombinase family protein [Yersinia enterocolitica]HDY4928346.1 recombinase family protein [Yersinia enterocolitica]HEC1634955.1 recombinase family protein [Yersinia enterocolitica]HED0387652.1 recombinase family protein [Yersinia enterocolitica]
MKKAIAYLRFSSPIQQYGDSLKRQNRLVEEWLEVNPDYLLDDLTYKDLGISAYHGTHATRGAFSDFMDAVEGGYIEYGTALLVESLDRLSREKIGEATERLKSILKAGIDVVTLSDHTHYTKDSLDDPYSLIKAILIAQRANEESEIKSRRMKSAWKKKREEAAASGKIITRSCPRWLKVNQRGDSFELIPEHARTIKEIFRLRLKGQSLNGIVKMLNDKKVITLTGEIGVWNPSTIEKLLVNKALIGINVPSYRTIANGIQEIPGYFPRVISDTIFYAVREFRKPPFGKDKHTDNPYLINLFRSVMKCKVCGHSIILNSIDGKGMGYYVCPMRRLHRCNTPSIRRDIADVNLITTVVIHADKFQTNSTSRGSTRSLQDRNIEVLKSIDKLIEALQIAPEVTALAEKIKALHKEFKSNEVTMRVAKNKQRLAVSEDVTNLDLTLKEDREKCRRFIFKTFKEIVLDTENKTCDICFSNGFKLINFPLLKSTNSEQLISALAYTDDSTLIL